VRRFAHEPRRLPRVALRQRCSRSAVNHARSSTVTFMERESVRPKHVRTETLPEIQVLRAVAVVAVVLYHLWPKQLPGGFVGVDVFFVISGFLITAHLMREVTATDTVGLTAFWARRIRRLLPASLLVLAATAITVWLVVPRTEWTVFFRGIAASALYVENWALATDSTDYLASADHASPSQHFWSLSTEEQFYLVWPLLIIGAIVLARLVKARRRTAIVVAISVVVAVSLAWSIVQTTIDPPAAYFSTFTRAWEFGAGGILGVALQATTRFVRPRFALSLTGWAAIAAALFVINSETPFPSYTALLPVAGTLAVIAAGSVGLPRWYRTTLSWRPVQFIGDISYSVYLWHWPLIILLPYIIDSSNPTVSKVEIIGLTLILAWLSRRFVEDPVRTGALSARRPWVTMAVMVLAVSLVAVPAWIGATAMQRQSAAEKAQVDELIATNTPCFGAAAREHIAQPCETQPLSALLLPSLDAAHDDYDAENFRACVTTTTTPIECVRGVEGGKRVALIGDSHLQMYVPALEAIAETEGWELHEFFKGGCAFSHAVKASDPVDGPGKCKQWSLNVDEVLAAQDPYAYVIVSNRGPSNRTFVLPDDVSKEKATRDWFLESWQPLIDRGAQIVAIRDAPNPDPEYIRCLRKNLETPETCELPLEEAFLAPDFLSLAAARVDGAIVVDLTDFFCDTTTCRVVQGNVLMYRDLDHISRTYALTLVPYLRDRILNPLIVGQAIP
jgi:peptidoglycan/LPS O-acetylase OafA/YrhL